MHMLLAYMTARIIILSFTKNVYVPSRKANKNNGSILVFLFAHLAFLYICPERSVAVNVRK